MENFIDWSKTICFDTETTGLGKKAEILQLSIISGLGNILFDELIKPKHTTAWPQAEGVHHISPDMVANKKQMDFHNPAIIEILKNAEVYVGYNLPFDIRMLAQSGILTDLFYRKHCRRIDVMEHFAPIYGEWDTVHKKYRWQNLVTCAAYCKYDWGDTQAHGALADSKATLFCLKKLLTQRRNLAKEVE